MKQQPGHRVLVVGTGSYLPGEPIPFDEVDQVLGELELVDDDFKRWYKRSKRTMKQLLGMESYYFALDPKTRAFTETPSTLAAKAAERALENAGLKPQDVDLRIYAGCSQDAFICPPTSTFVQQHLGIERCAELSIHANCTSTYKAIQVAADQIALGRYKTALITTANMVSGHALASTLNQKVLTRHQALLRFFLCDGGGALVLTRDEGQVGGFEIVDTLLESVGSKEAPQMYSRYGSASVAAEAIAAGDHHVTQNFQVVSSLGPESFLEGFDRFVQQLDFPPASQSFREEVTHFLANVPTDHLVDGAMESYARRYGVPEKEAKERYFSTVARRGYTGPVALAISLDELHRQNKLQHGKYLISFVTESSKWMNAGLLLHYRNLAESLQKPLASQPPQHWPEAA
ncbi:MAG: 3-oxoacyl-ACP synthase III family protein [Myxococcota bacterium]